MKSLPDYNEIYALHASYANSSRQLEDVFTHCEIVRDIAFQLMDTSKESFDRELVEAGSLLHDIGVYDIINGSDELRRPLPYILHGVEGEQILESEGYPYRLARIASHHTGAGLTAEQICRDQLPLPVKDYLAETPEEAVIMYADKFHTKLPQPVFNSFDSYRTFIAEFGKDVVERFDGLARRFGRPVLDHLVDKYGQPLL